MTDSDRPIPRPDHDADKAPRPDAAIPVSGRSATIADIGRELGDLDFEPEDLLASLRPFGAAEPTLAGDPAAPPTAVIPSPPPAMSKGDPEAECDDSLWSSPELLAGDHGEENATEDTSAKPPALVEGRDLAELAAAKSKDGAEVRAPARSAASGAGKEDATFLPEEPSTRALARVSQPPSERAQQPEVATSTEPSRASSTSFRTNLPRERPRALSAPRPGGDAPRPGGDAPRPTTVTSVKPPPAIPSPRDGSASVAGKRPIAPGRPTPLGSPKPHRIAAPPIPPAQAAKLADSKEPSASAATDDLPVVEVAAPMPPADAPDVVASDDSVQLEELVALPPERSDPLSFELERAACDHLRERNLLDAFHGLAVVLTREAQAPRHPQEQAELGLVTSELLAMLGDLDTARDYLNALVPVSTATTALQARQLAFCAQDLPTFTQLIKAELRGNVSHESRRHLMALYADVLRLHAADEAEGRRHLELSLRAFPSDPRFVLQRLSVQLGERGTSNKVRPPNLPDSPGLSDAVRDLLALRGTGAIGRECTHPAGALLNARRAWQRRDLRKLLEGITDLRSIDSLSDAATWLYVCMTALDPEQRDTGTAMLETLVGPDNREAELALLERRLHDSATCPSSVEVAALGTLADLAPADRLALGVAASADPETLRLLSDQTAERAQTAPLALAVQRIGATATTLADATDPDQIRLRIGTLIGDFARKTPPPSAAASPATDTEAAQQSDGEPNRAASSSRSKADRFEELAAAAQALGQCEPAEALPKLIALQRGLSDGDLNLVAQLLSQHCSEFFDAERPWLLVLGALLAQVAGSNELQLSLLEQAIAENGQLETAYRGLMALDSTEHPSIRLRRLAEHLEPSTRRTLLELEARIAESDQLQDFDASLPELGPLVAFLGAIQSPPAEHPWRQLFEQTESPPVRTVVALIDGLRAGPAHQPHLAAPAVSDAHELAARDPQLHELLRSLGSAVVPLADEQRALHQPLGTWLTLAELTRQLPFDLESLDASQMLAFAEQDSPILSHITNLFFAQSGGDQAVFTKQLDRATNAGSPALVVDALIDASAVDPDCERSLGSVQAARLILEHNPNHLGALRTTLRKAARDGSFSQMGHSAARIAQQLDQGERQAYAWLSIVSTTYTDGAEADLEQAIHLDTLQDRHDVLPNWASRRLLSLAQSRRDDTNILIHANQIRESSTRPIDAATLALRAAEAASRLGQWDSVGQLLEKAVEYYPEHLVALSMRAEFLEARGELSLAAQAFDALAQAACMPAHKVAAWVQAATLWTDSGCDQENTDRILAALERAVDLDPSHLEATTRLKAQYVARGDFAKLEELLTRQLLRTDDRTDRAELELDRARALMELGRIEEAQSGLERALSLVPDHEPALVLAARLHEDRGEFESAEQQLQRLAAASSDEARQVDAYERLATLYETFLEQPAQAENAYREILRRRPDAAVGDKLVSLLLRLDNSTAAVELLQQLIAQSTEPAIERDRNLELARIYDEVQHERRRAEEVLDRVRRRWPNDPMTIQALAAFYQRGKDQAAYNTLLERSIVDARRALGAGRFDATFFEVIGCVAELRGQPDLASIARATHSAILGRPTQIDGVGDRAADAQFGDSLAPEVLSLPLRVLLRQTGSAMCNVHPIDLRALRVTPLDQPQPELGEHIRALARAFGLYELALHLSPALGAVCQPTTSIPPTLVVGTAFVALTDRAIQDALVLRALRILSANTTALANTAPVDLWPLLVGYLSAYLPSWLPPGVDATKVGPIRERIQQVLPKRVDPELSQLAADVAASIGNRASQLGIAVQQWGSRTALLSLGDPAIVLSAIATASGQVERLKAGAEERQKWIVRNPEARDLAVFSVTDAYLEVRSRALSTNR